MYKNGKVDSPLNAAEVKIGGGGGQNGQKPRKISGDDVVVIFWRRTPLALSESDLMEA